MFNNIKRFFDKEVKGPSLTVYKPFNNSSVSIFLRISGVFLIIICFVFFFSYKGYLSNILDAVYFLGLEEQLNKLNAYTQRLISKLHIGGFDLTNNSEVVLGHHYLFNSNFNGDPITFMKSTFPFFTAGSFTKKFHTDIYYEYDFRHSKVVFQPRYFYSHKRTFMNYTREELYRCNLVNYRNFNNASNKTNIGILNYFYVWPGVFRQKGGWFDNDVKAYGRGVKFLVKSTVNYVCMMSASGYGGGGDFHFLFKYGKTWDTLHSVLAPIMFTNLMKDLYFVEPKCHGNFSINVNSYICYFIYFTYNYLIIFLKGCLSLVCYSFLFMILIMFDLHDKMKKDTNIDLRNKASLKNFKKEYFTVKEEIISTKSIIIDNIKILINKMKKNDYFN